MRSIHLAILAQSFALGVGCSNSAPATSSSSTSSQSSTVAQSSGMSSASAGGSAGMGGAGGASSSGGSGGAPMCDGDPSNPPSEGVALDKWLKSGCYLGWAKESKRHKSAGPHFGDVRVYINATLKSSLDGTGTEHAKDSAAVKELYGSGSTVIGFTFSKKLASDSSGGKNWYWYENYNGNKFADGTAVPLCVNCHTGGDDFVQIPYPLQ